MASIGSGSAMMRTLAWLRWMADQSRGWSLKWTGGMVFGKEKGRTGGCGENAFNMGVDRSVM